MLTKALLGALLLLLVGQGGEYGAVLRDLFIYLSIHSFMFLIIIIIIIFGFRFVCEWGCGLWNVYV